jgi:two-component system sensor histidine kinase YesM
MEEGMNIREKHGAGDGITQAKRTYSLRWGFFAILIVCWVLPVLIFSGTIFYLISENVSRHTGDTLTYNFNNSLTSAQNNMDSLLDASRAISYDSTVQRSHETYAEDLNYVQHYNRVISYLTTEYKYDNNIKDVFFFYTDDPHRVFAVSNARISGGARRLQTYMQTAHEDVLALYKSIGTDSRFVPFEDGVLLIRNLADRNNYEPYAVIVLSLNTTHVFSELEKNLWLSGKGGAVYIDGEKAVSVGDMAELNPADEAPGTVLKKYRGDYLLTAKVSLENHSIVYGAEAPDQSFREQFSVYYYIIIFTLIMTIVLMIVLMWFFYRNINKPVNELVHASNEIESGDLGYQIKARFLGKEFNYLSESYNSMSSQLKNMFELSIAEQVALHDARISALQSQIDPHFLNNTLEIIGWETRMAKAERASNMIEALSTILSAAMNRDGNAMIRIADELAYVDSYLYIVAERIKNRLTVVKEVDESLRDRLIPRLIMQPLVENAVKHGIVPNNGGMLTVRVYGDDRSLFLEVESDGTLTKKDIAMIESLLNYSKDEPFEPSENGRIGIRNVNHRIKLIYGEKSGLTITALNGGKVLSRITIEPQ